MITNDELLNAVQAAMDRPEVSAAVADVYRRLADSILDRRPICSASGRCCRFEQYGHRLYVTTLELAEFASQLRAHMHATGGAPPPMAGAPPRSLPILSDDGPGCRFQIDGLCSVHAIRPFGCRMFFCDPTAADWQQQTYERHHAQLKHLHESLQVPYFYVEWRSALAALAPVLAHCSAP